MNLDVEVKNLEETIHLGKRLGPLLDAGDVITLTGPLGAGKTAFVGGIAEGASIDSRYRVTSPTFVYAQVYPARVPIYHLDLYRIESDSQFSQLGLEEMIGGDGIALIEWFEKFPNLWTGDRLEVHVEYGVQEGCRIFHAKAFGEMKTKLTNWLDQ